MVTKEFSFLSKEGNVQIHGVKWMPDNGEVQAILQLSHGMVEYIERYEGLAEFFTQRGYLVVGNDHSGHGRSVVSEADWGYMGTKQPEQVLIEDLHTIRKMMQKEYPDLPYYMFGHSMGSYVLRCYMAMYGEGLSGAIIAGTGFVPNATTSLARFLTKVITTFRGDHYRSKFIQKNSFGGSYRKFDMNGEVPENSWLTRDVEVVKEYYQTPCCGYIFTTNGFLGLFNAVNYACKPENVAKIPKEIPVWIASGKDDPVGDLGVGVKKVYDMFMQARIRDVSMKLYVGARHELCNETNREEFWNDMYTWIETRKGRTS